MKSATVPISTPSDADSGDPQDVSMPRRSSRSRSKSPHPPDVPASVRRVLEAIPFVDDIATLFHYNAARHVVGSGMFATVYRAVPTAEACRRFNIPLVAGGSHHQQPAPSAELAANGPATTTATSASTAGRPQGIEDPGCSSRSSNSGASATHSIPPSPVGTLVSAAARAAAATTATDSNSPSTSSASAAFAITHHPPPALVALKVVNLSAILDAKEARNVIREISVLKRLRHPNVVGYYGAVQSKDAVFIAMPLVPGVTITQLLKASLAERVNIPEKAVRSIVTQLLEALRYLHQVKSMIHRDVKLDNVIVTVPPSEPVDFVITEGGPRPDDGRRVSTNKAAVHSNPSTTAPTGGGSGSQLSVAEEVLQRLCAPSAVFARLFEPGCRIHVTLVDFGFARTVTAPISVGSAAMAGSSSPLATPTGPQPGTRTSPATAGSCVKAVPSGPQFPPSAVPSAENGNLPPPTSTAAVNSNNTDAKLQFTPCGAHRFMPPEGLDALLHAGDSRREPHKGGLVACGDEDGGSVGGGIAYATANELRKTDPFAVGVIAYALLSLCFPWQGDTPLRIRDSMENGLRMKAAAWSDVSDEAKDFVKSLLRYAPSDRLSIEQALEHRWLRSDAS